MDYEIDYVDIETFLNNEQNGDTVWLHVLSKFTVLIARVHNFERTWAIKFVSQIVGDTLLREREKNCTLTPTTREVVIKDRPFLWFDVRLKCW